MNAFKPLNTNKYIKTEQFITQDVEYWKKLSVPTLVKEFGAIDYIDFSAIEPHFFAVTCSVRVQIYNPITKLVVKNLSRFQETAYGGTFRQDGRILAAGDEQGFVKLFDTSNKNILRVFKGHSRPVHRVKFTPDLKRIASFSDDRTVMIWDITTEKTLQSFKEHTDYIRAGAVNPISSDIIASGGYDGKVKMYDIRSNQVTAIIDHGKAIESLLFLPTGGILLSAGGTEVRVWDIFAGCRLIAKLSQHNKTITCLHLGSDGKRILSGSLDRHVKVYDIATYQSVYTLDFPDSILSLGVSPNDQTVAVGMVDGLISIQNMENNRKNEMITNRRINDFCFNANLEIRVDHELTIAKPKKEQIYNRFLRHYKYTKSLDSVLRAKVASKTPNITVSIIQELIRRKGLHRSLMFLSPYALILALKFIIRHIGEFRFMRVLLDASNILMDVFEDRSHEFNSELAQKFIQLSEIVKREIILSHELLEFQGAFEMLIVATGSTTSKGNDIIFTKDCNNTNLKQSDMAKESLVLAV